MFDRPAGKHWEDRMCPENNWPNNVASGTPDPLMGQRFLQALNGLISTSKIHLDNNKLLLEAVHHFAKAIEECLLFDDEINLIAAVGGFYLQQEKVGLQRNALGLSKKLLHYFSNRQIEGLRFKRSTAYVSRSDIITFIRLLNKAKNENNPAHWLFSQLEENRFNWVELIDTSQAQSIASIFEADNADSPVSGGSRIEPGKAISAKPTTKRPSQKEKAQNISTKKSSPPRKKRSETPLHRQRKRRARKAVLTYSSAMHSLQDVAKRLASNKNAGMGKSVQLVQNMVDLIMNDDNVLLDLSTIRDYDDYTFTHSINVSILSLCLGHRIGLSKVLLSRLGLSALFHDLGKIDIPKDVLNKPGKLNTDEFKIIQNHSIYSVRRILRLRASYDRKAGIMLAPFEHHLRYDLGGYPKTPRKIPISLFGRIITIADVYDAVTAPRIYRKTYMSQDKALGLMLKDSGTIFDPILLKVFINMLGIYPVGTVLVLDNGQLVLVAHPPEDAEDQGALWGMQLKRKKNGGYRKGKYINLGNWNPDTKSFNQHIQQTHHPADLGIQPAEFIMEI
jgi:HD-GYP domain-containing protein (c-di-GMP phosphodiesterase class II)